MTKIVWNGTSLAQERNEGYKNAEDNIFNHLASFEFEIEKTCLIPSDVQILTTSGIGIQYQSQGINVDCDILINNRLPNDYSYCNGYNIGFSYWETNALPKEWVEHMNKMDEIWTTSRWAKNVFIDSGVEVPVFNFKLGVDKNLYSPSLKKYPHRPFTFLSIGSPSIRKNSQIAVNAFLKLFGERDDVHLLYKSVDSPDARIFKNGEMKSVYNQPNITVVDVDLPANELSLIYDQVDCLIYPTSGEGWGLLPYQSLAKAIPTICTNATACTEYAELSVALDYKMGTTNMNGIYEGHGQWAEPNFQDLCDKMLYVISSYEEVSAKTYQNVVKVYDEMIWESAVKDYGNRICQILKEQKVKL